MIHLNKVDQIGINAILFDDDSKLIFNEFKNKNPSVRMAIIQYRKDKSSVDVNVIEKAITKFFKELETQFKRKNPNDAH